MDKLLIDSFNNLADALDRIVEALNKKSDKPQSATADALQTSNIDKSILEINNGIKKLLDDNKKILSNQETIIKLAKNKQSDVINDKISVDENKKVAIKDGLSMILLIAGGILAIGTAFKLIGTVDFASVLALSVSLPLIAYAYEKISNINIDTAKTAEVILMMAVTLTAASYILSLIKPISVAQGLTAVFIAGIFSLASYSLGRIFETIGESKITVGNLIKMPIILASTSAAIALSSFFMSFITPISINQGLTAILIASTFSIVASSLAKIVSATESIDIKNLYKLPLVMVSSAIAISLSSYALQFVQPVGLLQMISAIGISAMFAVISYGLSKIVKSTENIKYDSLVKLPLVMVAVSAAVALSSGILSLTAPLKLDQYLTVIGIAFAFIPLSATLLVVSEAINKINNWSKLAMLPIVMGVMAGAVFASSLIFSYIPTIKEDKLINIGLTAVTVSILAIAMSLPVMLLGKLSVEEILKGTSALVLIAGAIYLSSLLISKGEYSKYPTLDWVLNSGVGVAAFGLIAFLLGKYGSVAEMLSGSLSVVAVAASIFASSHLLSMGDYSNSPPLSWALGSGLSLFAFGVSALGLGTAIMATGGLGAVAIGAGLLAIVAISTAIVGVSNVLSGGNYGSYPTLSWALGVGASLLGFGVAASALGVIIVGSLGVGYLGIKAGLSAIENVANTVVSVSGILGKGSYGVYPTVAWSSGVALSLTAFTLATKMLDGTELLSSENNPLKSIARSIVDVAAVLGTGNYKGGPTYEWSKGISEALSGFAPVYGMMMASSLFGSNISPEAFGGAIMTVSMGIRDVAVFFGENATKFDVNSVPKKEWSSGVAESINAFMPALKYIQENDGIFSSGQGALTEGISAVANSIVDVSTTLLKGKFDYKINSEWIKGLKDMIKTYTDLAKFIEMEDSKSIDISDTIDSIVKLSESYGVMAKNVEKLNTQIGNINLEKMSALRSLSGSVIALSLMDPDQFENMMEALEEKSSIFNDVINNMEEGKSSLKTSDVTIGGGGNAKTVDDLYRIMSVNNQSIIAAVSWLQRIDKNTDKLNLKVQELTSNMNKPSIKKGK